MADKTSIQWTDATWNPVTGCDQISPGCAHCYAKDVARRFWAAQYPPVLVDGAFLPRVFEDVQIHRDRLDLPLRWKRPRMVFVNSMSDLFHEDVPDAFILDILNVIREAGALGRGHIFQVLTKRAERMQAMMSRLPTAFTRLMGNMWLGVSVENQTLANIRVPALLETPAAVRFVSYEPALSPVRFGAWLKDLHWMIIGGESGPEARPFLIEWAQSVIEDCRRAGCPVFVKQLGSVIGPGKGGDMTKWPPALQVREFPLGDRL